MYTVRKLFKFEAAHQLSDAVSAACYETIHGHSYEVELFLSAKTLNQAKMVMDFGALGDLKQWLLDKFDHALLIPDVFNPEYKEVLSMYNRKVWYTPENPTAEWMAAFIYSYAAGSFGRGVTVAGVRVHETDTGYAEYTP